jgi:transcriptional regulator with XRE-family HTH domain
VRLLILKKGRTKKKSIVQMKEPELGNYLRIHRRKSGLSQRQLGQLLGYDNEAQVSRHERSESVPPLDSALGYHIVFRVPITSLFPGIYEDMREAVESRLGQLEIRLQSRAVRGGEAEVIAKILMWMVERKDVDTEMDGD